jgi:hypothetical protein
VGVAGVDVAPGVDDSDHRLAPVILGGVTHLPGARAVAKRTQVPHPIPAVATQLFSASPPIHQGLLIGSVFRPRSSVCGEAYPPLSRRGGTWGL